MVCYFNEVLPFYLAAQGLTLYIHTHVYQWAQPQRNLEIQRYSCSQNYFVQREIKQACVDPRPSDHIIWRCPHCAPAPVAHISRQPVSAAYAYNNIISSSSSIYLYILIPTHFYHATTLQLRAFARHSASWPTGPMTIRHFYFSFFLVFNPGDLYYLG